ncbi:leucine-rich repeat-containing protein 74A-like, partial [Salvelinus sp. IW2-2015]|uniref:leucine-rich repeat-containing protein 74A-like n=1 Tax=Salvelinus sp. IW2-2015 TaxID=2691554 RepID=UPI0038D384F8
MSQSEGDVLTLPAPENKEEETVGSDQVLDGLGQEESPDSTPAEPDSGDEWDTDLEADEQDRRDRLVSPTELYLVACRLTAVIPCSYVLRQLASTTLDLNQQGTLDLNHHGLGPLGAKALAITLLSDVQISNLELKDNYLLAEGTGYLMEMFKENFTIQSLNLSNNHLQSAGSKHICKMLLDNVSIKSINLSGNGFIDADAKRLADALANNYRLKDLDLSHNQFCDTGGEHLGQMLANNEGLRDAGPELEPFEDEWSGDTVNVTLKQLDLSWNGFGSAGAQALGEALRHNNTLVHLDLSNNRVSDEGTALLCNGLAANDSLRVLRVVSDEGTALLCNGLAANDRLRVLRLAHNPLTQMGALTLLNSVRYNPKSALEEINISTVLVNEAFVELLEQCVRTVQSGGP